MDKNERRKTLSEMAKLNYGIALKEYFVEKLIELNDLTKIQDYEEFRAKKEAKEILLDMFKFLNITEKKIKEQGTNQYQ